MKIIAWMIRIILSLRYRIHIKGLEELEKHLKEHKKAGMLVLPNHPATIDPVILLACFLKKMPLSPLVTERFFESSWISFFLNKVEALPLPSMDVVVNQWKAKEIQLLYKRIKNQLAKGKNFIIYPAGKLKSSGLEVIGGSSFVHDLITDVPEATIVLVRTKGLWGSMFSRYLTGKTPPFTERIIEGIKILLKNGIFFTPRRDVYIEIEIPKESFVKNKDRLELNHQLEAWYNQYPQKGHEELFLVSYRFYKEEFLEQNLEESATYFKDDKEVSNEVKEEVLDFLAKVTRKSKEKLEPSTKLSTDLGLDSLDMAEIHAFLHDRYELAQLPAACLQTVADIQKAAAGFFKADFKEDPSTHMRKELPEKEARIEPCFPEGSSLQEVFLKACTQTPDLIACVDAMTASLSYRKLLMAALALSEEIKKRVKEEHVGIMLPATAGTYIVILATLLAKKIPVMMNWTAGKRSLEHAQKTTGLKAVLSSRKFLEKLDEADFGSVHEALVYIENVKKDMGLKAKLLALWRSRKSEKALFRTLKLESIKEDQPAVILFTSGTESLPKGVPLTHRNILSDLRASLECVEFNKGDRFFCVLPPFHSFGFSVTGLLPIFHRVLAVFSPDPTDSRKMADEIHFWKASVFCAAPSFIKALFFSAKKEQLQSLRLIVAGAEKTPQEVYDYLKKNLSHSTLIEGYGITECSPIVTIVRPEHITEGVGLPIPGVEVAILNIETEEFLSKGEEGEVCICGPNVFTGYLGISKDPFFTKEGKKWYRSGDRGKLTQEGSLVLSGRYKRFMKIGGEMVSLGGLEDDVIAILKDSGTLKSSETPLVAIGAKKDDEEKSEIVLFTTLEVDLDRVNQALRNKGYARIVKISNIKKVDEIPLTGTGKVNHRSLEENL